MEYTIRSASVADLDALERLEALCFSTPWKRSTLEWFLPDDRHEFLLAVQGETILGYINLLHVMDEGYIGNVAVHPDYRRNGIGAALVKAMLKRSEELELLFATLEVRDSNEPAINLYASHGFESVGRRKGYYDRPKEDAILMTYYWKELD